MLVDWTIAPKGDCDPDQKANVQAEPEFGTIGNYRAERIFAFNK
jgi:hypothetical protein